MSVHYIPPKDPRALRLEKARGKLVETLKPFVTGKGKDAKLEKAVDAVMEVFTPLLKLPSAQDKGATVMTEAATRDERGEFRKGPSNL